MRFLVQRHYSLALYSRGKGATPEFGAETYYLARFHRAHITSKTFYCPTCSQTNKLIDSNKECHEGLYEGHKEL